MVALNKLTYVHYKTYLSRHWFDQELAQNLLRFIVAPFCRSTLLMLPREMFWVCLKYLHLVNHYCIFGYVSFYLAFKTHADIKKKISTHNIKDVTCITGNMKNIPIQYNDKCSQRKPQKKCYFHRDLEYKEGKSSVSNVFFTSLVPKLHFRKV